MMAERPLFFFPTPQLAEKTPGDPRFRPIHKPSIAKQGQRTAPLFNELEAAFEARRIELQQSVTGIDPEQVLVIETIGSVEDFAKAVKRFDGLEWMGEFELEDIEPDEDFYDQKKPGKNLAGRLFLVMTNQRALNELLSLWRRYQVDQSTDFGYGRTKVRDVFLHLKDIRRWDVQDRLQESGILDYWRERLEIAGEQVIPFEVELWFRGNENLRATSENIVTELIRQAGGQVLSQSVIEGIAYHGLLAELPAQAIRTIVESQATELVKCENVMFFRPMGQMAIGNTPPEGDVGAVTFEEKPLPDGEPIIALFDGLPLARHRLLAGRLVVDDPDNWESDYAASERIHGSAMASLIIHGDVNTSQEPLARQVYVRPLMKPLPSGSPRWEEAPSDCLFVDLVHRAVKRLFEGDPGEEPAAPHVKVVNFSICDRTRQFTHSMSPLAKLLDWLSEKYKVLFIVSAGNHQHQIPLGISRKEFNSLQDNELKTVTIKALYNDRWNRRLLSPAETINGVSVGAVHRDDTDAIPTGDNIDPFLDILPSPISAFGGGYRRAIKPDIIYDGGRQWYRHPMQPTDPVLIEPIAFVSPPGHRVACPGTQAGDLSATYHMRGTSNAAALISRAAGICYDSLQQIIKEQADDRDSSPCEAALLKTMLTHGCSWSNMRSHISDSLRTPENGRQLTKFVSQWIGYGMPVIERVLDCTQQRATVLGYGELTDGKAHVFSFPLPESLESRAEWRRLTVTLAWLSPIQASTQKYRVANLWFELTNNGLASDRRDADHNAVKRGTVQHEVFEGRRAEPYTNGDAIEIKVNPDYSVNSS